jgi:phosphoglucomutase
LERAGETNRFIFGFEESYGYVSGSHVRDKDGVNATLLACEMHAFYRAQKKTLLDALEDLYQTYGYFTDILRTFAFEGAEGLGTMREIMLALRKNPPREIAGFKVVFVSDFESSVTTFADGRTEPISLPVSNVLKFALQDDVYAIARPSGTEPKLKLYFLAKGKSRAESEEICQKLEHDFERRIEKLTKG